jgi:hypothetical protein
MLYRFGINHYSVARGGCLFAALVVLPILLGYWFLDLAHWDLSVPLVYGNPGHDEIWQLILTKMLTDTGWVLNSPFLGAPDSAHWHYHSAAQTSPLHSVIMLGLSIFFQDAVELQQFYYLINFSLISLASYWCSRRLRIDTFTSACIGLLFSFTTFRFNAPFFAFLVNYFSIPLAMIAVFDVKRGTFFAIAGDPETTDLGSRSRSILSSQPFLTGLFGVFMVAIADGYYAFFTILLLGFSLAARVVAGDHKRSLSLVPGLIYIAAILLISLSLLVPVSLYKAAHQDEFFPDGKADPTLIKHAFEAEVYSSSLKLLLSPAVNHRLGSFAEIGKHMVETSNAGRKYPNGQQISIGLLGGLLLVGALLLLGTPSSVFRLGVCGSNKNTELVSAVPMPVIWASLSLTLFGLLCSTAGGIGSLVALIYPTIRAYDRFPLFLLFTLYAGAGSLFTGWLMRQSPKKKRWGMGLLALVVIASIFDQVPRDAAKTNPELMTRFLAEQRFVHQLERALPPGSMVYQYPYSQYLQDNKYYGWGAFSHLRLYLHSHELRWSNGASKNSPVDDWHLRQSRLPIKQMVENMHDAGFSAVVLDRAVLPPDEYKLALAALVQYAGTSANEDPVSGLTWVKLADRGYRLQYDDAYKTVKEIQVTDSEIIRKSSLSNRVNKDVLMPLLAKHSSEKAFNLPAIGIIEDEGILSRGKGDVKIVPFTEFEGALICSTLDRKAALGLSDTVKLKIDNKGNFDWLMDQGKYPIRIGIHVLAMDGTILRWDDGFRVDSKSYVPRKESIAISFSLTRLNLSDIPSTINKFKVAFGIVQDGNAWFAPASCAVDVHR